MGDKWEGGVKNIKKWVKSFMDGPLHCFFPSAQQNFTTQEMEQQQMCVPIDLTVVLYIH